MYTPVDDGRMLDSATHVRTRAVAVSDAQKGSATVNGLWLVVAVVPVYFVAGIVFFVGLFWLELRQMRRHPIDRRISSGYRAPRSTRPPAPRTQLFPAIPVGGGMGDAAPRRVVHRAPSVSIDVNRGIPTRTSGRRSASRR